MQEPTIVIQNPLLDEHLSLEEDAVQDHPLVNLNVREVHNCFTSVSITVPLENTGILTLQKARGLLE
jgi:hypothetical protein